MMYSLYNFISTRLQINELFSDNYFVVIFFALYDYIN